MILEYRLNLRTRNPLNGQLSNSRLAAIIQKRERASHRAASRLHLLAAMRGRSLAPTALVPCVVTLTRESAGKMDDDGLAASCKGIRDGIADALGINDGGPFVTWLYGQAKCPQGGFGVRVSIEKRTDQLVCTWCLVRPSVETCGDDAICRYCHAAKRVSYPCRCLTLAHAQAVLKESEESHARP